MAKSFNLTEISKHIYDTRENIAALRTTSLAEPIPLEDIEKLADMAEVLIYAVMGAVTEKDIAAVADDFMKRIGA